MALCALVSVTEVTFPSESRYCASKIQSMCSSSSNNSSMSLKNSSSSAAGAGASVSKERRKALRFEHEARVIGFSRHTADRHEECYIQAARARVSPDLPWRQDNRQIFNCTTYTKLDMLVHLIVALTAISIVIRHDDEIMMWWCFRPVSQ
eukprot:scaffold107_cov154-Amphora_coffeaeformis.AAC.1